MILLIFLLERREGRMNRAVVMKHNNAKFMTDDFPSRRYFFARVAFAGLRDIVFHANDTLSHPGAFISKIVLNFFAPRYDLLIRGAEAVFAEGTHRRINSGYNHSAPTLKLRIVAIQG